MNFFRRLQNRNLPAMVAGDVCLIGLSYYLAYYLRFDGLILPSFFEKFLQTLLWVILIKVSVFYTFDLYKGMWRYTGVYDLFNLVKAAFASTALILLAILLSTGFQGFSRSVFAIDLILTLLLIGGFRVSIRLYFSRQSKVFLKSFFTRKTRSRRKRLLILGAGDAGEKLLRELWDNRDLHYEVVGFLDDHPGKQKHTIHGVPVLGTCDDLAEILEQHDVDEMVIAIARISAQGMRRLVELCRQSGKTFRIMPGLGELIEGRVSVKALREVQYVDLLGRDQTTLDMDAIGGYLTGRRVLVTGGCGSIGSELCRQIARFRPERLIILDQSESGLYEFDLELRRQHPNLNVMVVLASVRNEVRMNAAFKEHRPQVVFHAAAYKHVPMMETYPWEAVTNNIQGSRIVLETCIRFEAERCVIVSTDKAVRPTNVMGATKRVVEMMAQCHSARQSITRIMAVRFGNVIGSAGSVLPLFQKQIENGGPVTVTHPDVTRFFMTIPEAAQLILQAGAMGRQGEIFILKMGTPVKIVEMARDMIRLFGLEPDTDIRIEFTGLRPGEKLYEELITEGEDIARTDREDIMVLKADGPQRMEDLFAQVDALVEAARHGDGDGIRRKLREIVPEYGPDSREN